MKPRALLLMLCTLGPLGAYAAADYPTLDRVDFVLTCMQENGGQNIDNLQRCSCELDVIMQEIDFDTYIETRTFEMYQQMPADKGASLRDNPRGKGLMKKLNAVRADAKKRCFVGAVRQKNAPKAPPKVIAAPQ